MGINTRFWNISILAQRRRLVDGKMILTIKDIAPYIGSGQFLEIKIFNPANKGKRLLYKRITIDTDTKELCKPYEDMEVYLIYSDLKSASLVLVIEVTDENKV